MRKFFVLAVVATFALAVGGCKRTHEDVAKDMASKMEDMAKVIEGVKDESSAKSAATKLQSLSDDLKKLTDEASKMPEPDASAKAGLEAQQKRVFEAIGRLASAMMKLDPKLAKIVEPSMGKIGGGGPGMFK